MISCFSRSQLRLSSHATLSEQGVLAGSRLIKIIAYFLTYLGLYLTKNNYVNNVNDFCFPNILPEMGRGGCPIKVPFKSLKTCHHSHTYCIPGYLKVRSTWTMFWSLHPPGSLPEAGMPFQITLAHVPQIMVIKQGVLWKSYWATGHN